MKRISAASRLVALTLSVALSSSAFAEEMKPMSIDSLASSQIGTSDILYAAERCAALYTIVGALASNTPGMEMTVITYSSKIDLLSSFSRKLENDLDYSKSYVENDVNSIAAIYATSARESYLKTGKQLNSLLVSDLKTCKSAMEDIFPKYIGD